MKYIEVGNKKGKDRLVKIYSALGDDPEVFELEYQKAL